MTTKANSSQAYSAVPLRDQEVSLLDQIRWVVAGQKVCDVELIAVKLLLECAVQQTHSKPEAFRFFHTLMLHMAHTLDEDYDDIAGLNNAVIVKGPWQ